MQNKKKVKPIKKQKKNKNHSKTQNKFSKNRNPSITQNPQPNEQTKLNNRRRSPPTPIRLPKLSIKTSKRRWWKGQPVPKNSSNSLNDFIHITIEKIKINWRNPWGKFCWACQVLAFSSCDEPCWRRHFWASLFSSLRITTFLLHWPKLFRIS